MSDVKRYAMSRKGMVSMPIGDYVRHKDYAALQARVAELKAANRGLVRLNETTEARATLAEIGEGHE